MIRKEDIEKLSIRYQLPLLAVVREYCQHNFLASLYTQKNAEKLLFKGGTALRIIFRSPRFSEDLDFTGIHNITYQEIEEILANVLSDLNFWGFNINLLEAKKTTGGYLAKIDFSIFESKFFIKMEISFRTSRKKIKKQVSSIRNDYIHTYSIVHLILEEIIEGKISALLTRAKARDWYDFYFFLHNQMMSYEHKKNYPKILEKLKKTSIDFKKELKNFLPRSHQMILRDFKNILKKEIEKYF